VSKLLLRPLLVRLTERARRLGERLRHPDSGSRSLPDPLAALWRLAGARRAPWAAAGVLAVLAVSALLAPGAYLVPGIALGLAADRWPGLAARLAALSLLAARPWGFAVLALCVLVAAVQGAQRFGRTPAVAQMAAAGGGERVLLYSDRSLAAVRARVRLLAALAGYRWLPGEPSTTLDRAGTRRTCAGVAALSLALAAFLLMLWPRVSAVEAVALAEGDATSLSLSTGYVLVSNPATSGSPRFVLRTASGDVAATPLLPGSWAAVDVTVLRHGRGPALLVRPGASPLSGTAEDPLTVAIGFSAAENSQLVTIPGVGKTVRVSLVRGGPVPAFDVQLVDSGGVPQGAPYRLDTPAVLTLSGVTLAFRPTSYDALSLWRAPLTLPLLAALLLAGGAALLTIAYRGPALALAMRASGPVVGVELSAAAGPLRVTWLPLLRLLLR
jgi:hypothetical protein